MTCSYRLEPGWCTACKSRPSGETSGSSRSWVWVHVLGSLCLGHCVGWCVVSNQEDILASMTRFIYLLQLKECPLLLLLTFSDKHCGGSSLSYGMSCGQVTNTWLLTLSNRESDLQSPVPFGGTCSSKLRCNLRVLKEKYERERLHRCVNTATYWSSYVITPRGGFSILPKTWSATDKTR